MGFVKEEIGWLLDHLKKASKMDRSMDFNPKYIGRTRTSIGGVNKP